MFPMTPNPSSQFLTIPTLLVCMCVHTHSQTHLHTDPQVQTSLKLSPPENQCSKWAQSLQAIWTTSEVQAVSLTS